MCVLYVSVERRYKLYKGQYFLQGIENCAFFERYLQCFETVKVIARVEKVSIRPQNHELFEHTDIHIEPIFTTGTGVSSLSRVNELTKLISHQKASVIIRTPGILAYLLSLFFIFKKIKFSLEVVTNPLQEAVHLTKNPVLKFVFGLVFINIFKLQLKYTQLASFVTKFEIQNQFLSEKFLGSPRYNSSYSSVVLHNESFANESIINTRIIRNKDNQHINLLFIGVLDRDFKGLDVFLNLISLLPAEYNATVLGDGLLLPHYKKLAHELKISSRVEFCGYVSSIAAKQEIMAKADFFILTSRREGLPRVVIEAMAYGLPCICSCVSGVRELIDEKYIFPINDFHAAKSILTNINDNEYSEMSRINFINSKEYNHSTLNEKRKSFYLKVISSENTTFK